MAYYLNQAYKFGRVALMGKRMYNAFSGGRSRKRRRTVPGRRMYRGGGFLRQPKYARGAGYISRRRAAPLARTGGFTGIEKKFVDSTRVGLTVASPAAGAGGEIDPATVNCLNAVSQGDGESQRDGRQARLLGITVKGHLERTQVSDQADTGAAATLFIALILDKQTNGAQFNSEDVYVNPGNNSVTGPHPFRNLANVARFDVLASKTVSFDGPTTGTDGTNTLSTSGQSRPFVFSKPLNLVVNYTGTTANVSTVSDYSLHLVAYASSAGFTVSYNARVRFVG